MVEKDRFLVVVSVLEGRKFPKRSKHTIIVEAKFDGEQLSTDPVTHATEVPDFTQELAWELDKKGLHQHRLQRTSIKVQVYAVDNASSSKEAVGYVVLDLRSAQNTQTPKWYPLLHTKYSKSKPEIRLSLYIDDDKGGLESSFKAKEAPARKAQWPPEHHPSQTGPSHGIEDQDAKGLKPMLNEDEGYYQIGPPDRCTEQFLLSVTVAFASNLPQLIPTNLALPPTGYFFYYSLFGNDVTNETFHDLLNPTFPAERASVRVRSSVDTLRGFFSSQPGLEIHLCCGDQSLGNCEVPLEPLLKKGSTEIYMKPVSIEGAFTMNPPNRLKSQLAAVADEMKPTVGVSIVLRKEDLSNPTTKDSPGKDPQSSSPPAKKSPSHPLAKTKGKKKSPPFGQTPPTRERAITPPTPHDGSYSENFEPASTVSNVSNIVDDEQQAKKKGSPGVKPKKGAADTFTPDRPTQAPQLPAMMLDNRNIDPPTDSSTQKHIAIPAQAHHFCFSVDLRSLRHLDIPHHVNAFLRYTYPFFGSASPILTHPPVEVRPGTEVLMPQSFCAFDFATSIQQLHDTFMRLPLVVEVWDRDKDKNQNNLVGAVQIQLSNVMGVEKSRATHTSGMNGWRQVWSDRVPVFTSEGQAKRIGDMHVVLSLEDWGPINTQKIVTGQDTTSQATTISSQGASVSDMAPVKAAPPKKEEPAPEPRETQEYQAAMELEMWKEQQEQMFEKELKSKEISHMKALAEEWKKRDKEREVMVKKKIVEYQQLEEQLKKTLSDLEKRDRQLSANEQEVLRLKKDLEREHERKMTEVREASRRMKEDCDHQVQLERKKLSDTEEYVLKIKTHLGEQEDKYKGLEKEFKVYKEQQNSKPEVRLQSEINLLTLEKVELERKLDAVTKSKVHYKQQWGRALKELARLKQKEQAVAKATLKKQQQELEHMRLRYLAAEEKDLVQTERKELKEIENELNQLREHVPDTQKQSTYTNGGTMHPLTPDFQADDDEHITRLIEERDSLLRTGVYTSEDPIISELDRQIREAIATKGREDEKRRVVQAIRRDQASFDMG